MSAQRFIAPARFTFIAFVLISASSAGSESRPADIAGGDPPDAIFADGFDGAQPLVSRYDDLTEGFLGTDFDYNGVGYHDVNGIGGVFPDGSTFTPGDVGNQLIIEDSTIFYNDFPHFGSTPNTLTFGTSFVTGPNLTIGALVRVTMTLDAPASEARVDVAYYENGPWGGIEIHLDALDGGTVVASDVITIANGGDRDNPTTATMSVAATTFDALKLYATYDGQPTAPRIMIDNLAITPQ